MKYIITAKLRKNDDSPLTYVEDVELIDEEEIDYKNKKVCHYMPTITWFKNAACKMEEVQAKQIFNELKKLPDL